MYERGDNIPDQRNWLDLDEGLSAGRWSDGLSVQPLEVDTVRAGQHASLFDRRDTLQVRLHNGLDLTIATCTEATAMRQLATSHAAGNVEIGGYLQVEVAGNSFAERALHIPQASEVLPYGAKPRGELVVSLMTDFKEMQQVARDVLNVFPVTGKVPLFLNGGQKDALSNFRGWASYMQLDALGFNGTHHTMKNRSLVELAEIVVNRKVPALADRSIKPDLDRSLLPCIGTHTHPTPVVDISNISLSFDLRDAFIQRSFEDLKGVVDLWKQKRGESGVTSDGHFDNLVECNSPDDFAHWCVRNYGFPSGSDLWHVQDGHDFSVSVGADGSKIDLKIEKIVHPNGYSYAILDTNTPEEFTLLYRVGNQFFKGIANIRAYRGAVGGEIEKYWEKVFREHKELKVVGIEEAV